MNDKEGGLIFFFNISTLYTLRKLWNVNVICSQCSGPLLTCFALSTSLSINTPSTSVKITCYTNTTSFCVVPWKAEL